MTVKIADTPEVQELFKSVCGFQDEGGSDSVEAPEELAAHLLKLLKAEPGQQDAATRLGVERDRP